MKYFAFILMVFVTSCSGVDIERLKDNKPLPVPQGVKPHVIGLSNLKVLIPRGTNTAGLGPKGISGIIRCQFPWGPVQGVSLSALTNKGQIRQRFADTMESLGYDVAGNPGLLFNEDEDSMRTRYRIGARVVNMGVDLCVDQNMLFPQLLTGKGTRGEANLTVDWVVYDGLNKKIIYKTTTKGYAELSSSIQEGASILLENALTSAIHALGTDKPFHQLIFEGLQPSLKGDDLGIDRERLPPEDWSEIVIATGKKPFGKSIELMQKATVLIESGAGGHGSGFFIADGLIITNAHVVGFADTVRVTLSGKADYYLARLVRADRPRDIAILRLVEKQDSKLYTIPKLSDGKTSLGDNVYVVGAPQYKKLQDTVTSGIISAHRYDSKLRQTYIQSDVDIHGGNSGGPMFNNKGEVIGISVLGFINRQSGAQLSGLNWFIPINDAMNQLDIKKKQ